MPGARSHDLPYVLGLTEVSQDQSRAVDEPSGAASAAPRASPLEGLEVPRRDHEVARLRVMEHERRHRRLGVHHVAFGHAHADRALHVERGATKSARQRPSPVDWRGKLKVSTTWWPGP